MVKTSVQNIYEFDDFRLDTAHLMLYRGEEEISLAPKAVQTLLTLIERRGEIITKDELMKTIWNDSIVEEANLTQYVHVLRKTLGESANGKPLIETLRRRGYRFNGDVRQTQANPMNGHAKEIAVVPILPETDGNGSANRANALTTNKSESPVFRKSRRLMFSVIGSLLIFAAVLGVGGYILWQQQSSQAKNSAVAPSFDAASIKRLTTKGNVQLAALSPDGKLFAYTTADFEKQSLWIGYIQEGGEHLQLRSNAEVNYLRLEFAPDGSGLFYTMTTPDAPAPTLYKSPLLGGLQEKVRKNMPPSFALSPDGKQIAFERNVPEEKRSALIISNPDGSAEREIVSLSPPQLFVDGSVSWSPDSNLIAYAMLRDGLDTEQNLFVARVTDGQIEQISKTGWGEITKTAWMSDGSGLVILAQPLGNWNSVYYEQIWLVSYPSGETVKVTSDLSNYNSALGVSGDLTTLLSIEYREMMNIWTAPADDFSQAKQLTFGSFGKNDGYTGLAFRHDGKILYTSTVANSQVISLMDADGGNVKQLTPPGSVNSQLSVSGDGRYVFFHSNRSGLYEIWRMDADGANQTRMTTSGQNFQSYASPDSKWVYFKSWSDGTGKVWRVPAEGGEPQPITEKECSRFALSPDGKFLACETDNRLVILPAEGGKPLKQFEFPASSLRWYGMHWTPDSKAVAFRDNFYGIWKQPIEANASAERIVGLPKEKIYRFAWSPDGKQFAFVRGQEIRDVVLFRNLK